MSAHDISRVLQHSIVVINHCHCFGDILGHCEAATDDFDGVGVIVLGKVTKLELDIRVIFDDCGEQLFAGASASWQSLLRISWEEPLASVHRHCPRRHHCRRVVEAYSPSTSDPRP